MLIVLLLGIVSAQDCSTQLSITGAVTTSCAASTVDGGTCETACDDGYVGNDPKTYTCTTGSWVPAGGTALTCDPVSCGSEITDLPRTATANCVNNDYTNTCTADCSPGYSGTQTVYVCGSNRQWSPQSSAIECSPLSCPSTIAGVDTTSTDYSCSSLTFGSDCVTQCANGYEDTSKVSAEYECDSGQTWELQDAGAMNCQAVSCGSRITSASLSSTSCSPSSFGNSCVAICISGYKGDDKTYTCAANKQWTADDGELECALEQCPEVIPNLPANANATCLSTFFSSLCTSQCDPGYVDAAGVGSESYLCWYGETWLKTSANTLTCNPVDCGSTVSGPNPTMADVSCSGTTTFSPNEGTTCDVECNPGYDGSTVTYYCSESADWTAQTSASSCTPKVCGAFTDPNDSTVHCSGTHYLDTCTTTCNDGFDGGSVTYTCGTGGTWEAAGGNALSCTAVDCGSVIPGLDTRGYDCLTDTKFGDSACSVSCTVGFTAASADYECNSAGSWQPVTSALTCTALDCGTTLPNYDSATMFSNCDQFDTTFGHSCSATCIDGYNGGSRSYTCDSTGNWAPVGGPNLACTAKDCRSVIPGATNGDYTCASTTYGGADCTTSCAAGFMGSDADYSCGTSGVWEAVSVNEPLDCAPVSCGSSITGLDSNANAVCTGSTWYGGDPCTAICTTGYKGDSKTYYCAADGSWTCHDTVISCALVDCGSGIQSLDVGSNQTVCEEPSTYGEFCDASCGDGYSGQPKTYECLSDSLWSPINGSIACVADEPQPVINNYEDSDDSTLSIIGLVVVCSLILCIIGACVWFWMDDEKRGMKKGLTKKQMGQILAMFEFDDETRHLRLMRQETQFDLIIPDSTTHSAPEGLEISGTKELLNEDC